MALATLWTRCLQASERPRLLTIKWRHLPALTDVLWCFLDLSKLLSVLK